MGIMRSTNNGDNWIQTSVNNISAPALAVNSDTIYAGLNGGDLYKSTNNGVNWTIIYLFSQTPLYILVNGNNIFAGTQFYGVYVSTDNGIGWVQRYEGLPGNVWISGLCVLNNYLFAGTYTPGNGVWRKPIGERVGIQPVSNEVPNIFSLFQNYPNPFNPSTYIEFALPYSSFAKLIVYDIMGREVQTLVIEELKAGTYKADFDGTSLSSGMCFLLIQPRIIQTQKK